MRIIIIFTLYSVRWVAIALFQDAGALAEFKGASEAFHRVFRMPPEEKLINYYSCSYWRKSAGGVPKQGWMYEPHPPLNRSP